MHARVRTENLRVVIAVMLMNELSVRITSVSPGSRSRSCWQCRLTGVAPAMTSNPPAVGSARLAPGFEESWTRDV